MSDCVNSGQRQPPPVVDLIELGVHSLFLSDRHLFDNHNATVMLPMKMPNANTSARTAHAIFGIPHIMPRLSMSSGSSDCQSFCCSGLGTGGCLDSIVECLGSSICSAASLPLLSDPSEVNDCSGSGAVTHNPLEVRRKTTEATVTGFMTDTTTFNVEKYHHKAC